MPARHALPVALLFASSLCFVPASLAQDAASTSSSAPVSTIHASCSFSVGPYMFPPQAPKSTTPYSATEETSHLQTLADGTHITQGPRTTRIYHDSQGRTRQERSFCDHGLKGDFANVVIIRDPVEGITYVLDMENHVAHRLTSSGDAKSQAVSSTPVARASSSSSNVAVFTSSSSANGSSMSSSAIQVGSSLSSSAHSEMTVESENLGTQVMEGLTVEGKRTVRTIPINAEGNDQPIKIVWESWFSPDLKTNVLTRSSDPRNGETTFRLIDVNLSEPDPALFGPPADYKIVDDSSSVHIEYTR
jgi:hypothetical protein